MCAEKLATVYIVGQGRVLVIGETEWGWRR